MKKRRKTGILLLCIILLSGLLTGARGETKLSEMAGHKNLDNEGQTIALIDREETVGGRQESSGVVQTDRVEIRDVKTGDEDRILRGMYLLLLILLLIAICLGRRWSQYDHLIKK